MFREPKPGYSEVMELLARLQPEYPTCEEIQRAIKELFAEHQATYRHEVEATGKVWDEEAVRQDPWRGIYPYSRGEYRDQAGRFVPQEQAREAGASIWVWSEISAAAPASKQSPTTRDPNHYNYRFYKPKHPTTGKPCQHPRTGWKFPHAPDPANPSRRTFVDLDHDRRIVWGEDEAKLPRTKGFLHEVETNIGTSVFYAYNDGEAELARLFGESGLFLSPKSSSFVRKFINQTTRNGEWFADFFGGSGSSGHALIATNREDGGRRKLILVEMGDHFDALLVPRLQKVIYSPEWQDGKPRRPATAEEVERGPRLLKVLRLESYEDALHNLTTPEEAERVERRARPAAGPGNERDYRLRYLVRLPRETGDTLFPLAELAHPFTCALETLTDAGPRVSPVDLVETFNWLAGLRVQRFERWKNDADAGREYRAVHARDREHRRVLVLWRDVADVQPEVERAFLEARIAAEGSFDRVWINGDTALPGARSLDAEFVRLMEEPVS